jgi:hypothetical protein
MKKNLFFLTLVLFMFIAVSLQPGNADKAADKESADFSVPPEVKVYVSIDKTEYVTKLMPPYYHPPVIKIVFVVTNHGQSSVTLKFSSSQRFDFFIYDISGKEVWRWSHGMGFLQAIGYVHLKPGQSVTYTQDCKFEDKKNAKPMPAGRYTLKGILAKTGSPVSQVSFTHKHIR